MCFNESSLQRLFDKHVVSNREKLYFLTNSVSSLHCESLVKKGINIHPNTLRRGSILMNQKYKVYSFWHQIRYFPAFRNLMCANLSIKLKNYFHTAELFEIAFYNLVPRTFCLSSALRFRRPICKKRRQVLESRLNFLFLNRES